MKGTLLGISELVNNGLHLPPSSGIGTRTRNGGAYLRRIKKICVYIYTKRRHGSLGDNRAVNQVPKCVCDL